MPLYDFECSCGYKAERIARVDEKIRCPECKRYLKRCMPSTHGIAMGVGAYGYYDESLQAYCGTNRQRKEIMREQGVVEKVGKGWY